MNVVALAAPLIPDGEEGRRWAEQELSDTAYRTAEPTPIDRVAQAIGDAIGSLFSGGAPGGLGAVFAVVAAVVLVAIVVLALLVWGRPRTRARSRAARTATLFGEETARSARQLRDDAERQARAGAWDEAIATAVRALARDLDERGLVETAPGATVHAFARQAGRVFPDEAAALHSCASDFDDVRYLRRPGTPEAYERVRAVDGRLRAERAGVA
ncbi:DUF4129 domain-containing protein [Microbacterium sp. NPDC089189]|uniref:DUF4129 domain-containing protein n=1 Tax=Microbacterium sp. NPDC089189 TaxID=3154972 RepID=UPI0034130484